MKQNKYEKTKSPAKPKLAELLKTGCIRNYPSTMELRAMGKIGEHVRKYTPPKKTEKFPEKN